MQAKSKSLKQGIEKVAQCETEEKTYYRGCNEKAAKKNA